MLISRPALTWIINDHEITKASIVTEGERRDFLKDVLTSFDDNHLESVQAEAVAGKSINSLTAIGKLAADAAIYDYVEELIATEYESILEFPAIDPDDDPRIEDHPALSLVV